MNPVFSVGWFLLLAVIGLRAFRARTLPRVQESLVHVGLGLLVVLWVAQPMVAMEEARGPAMALVELRIDDPGTAGSTVDVGGTAASDVEIPSAGLAPVHLSVRWPQGGAAPEIWNASLDRRVELGGVEIHDIPVDGAAVLDAFGHEVRLAAQGGRISLVAPGLDADLSLPFHARLVDNWPAFRRREWDLGFLVFEQGVRWQADRPIAGAAALRLYSRGGVVRIGHLDARERAAATWTLRPEGGAPVSPATRWTPMEDGDVLGIGHVRMAVHLAGARTIHLRPLGAAPRWPMGEGGLSLGVGEAALLVSETPGGLRIAQLATAPGRGLARIDGAWVPGHTAVDGAPLSAGDQMAVDLGPGLHARFELRPALGRLGFHDGLRPLHGAALGYLTLAAVLPFRGVLHGAATGLFHAAALLCGLGLLLLLRLSDAGPGPRSGLADRQALALAAVLLLSALAVWVAPAVLHRWRRRRRPRSMDRRVQEHGPWVVALALLTLQLPFGELGIALPGYGSFQPVELARTLLCLHLGLWSARAWEHKVEWLRGRETAASRWRHLLHAAPVFGAMALCAAVSDHSPVLVLSALCVILALALLRRPTLGFGAGQFKASLLWDLASLALATAALGAVLLHDDSSTASVRVRAFLDPFDPMAESEQAVAASWAAARGGLFGIGWTAPGGPLPPAIKDDFILVLLAERGGAVAVALLASTFALLIAAGAQALLRTRTDARRTPRDAARAMWIGGAMLWMLAIQVVVVLGSATGGLPVVGQPLPFVAAAGSHIVFFCVPCVATVLWAVRRPLLDGAGAPDDVSVFGPTSWSPTTGHSAHGD